MKKNDIQILALKIGKIVTLLIGMFLTTYNLFSFKIAKNGYYNDDNQTWLAVGICFLTIAYVIKNWNEL